MLLKNFVADPNVFDPSRILRVPGTYNQKKDDPKLVKIINPAPARHAPNDIRALLGVDPNAVIVKRSSRARY